MWKKSVIAGIVALACGLPVPAHSGEYDDYEDYKDAHPLRLIAYPLHALGYGLERLITRPIHSLVSRPALAPVFGYERDEFSSEQCSTGLFSSGPASPPVPRAPFIDAKESAAALPSEQSAQEADLPLLR